jgi:putative oxidoreductase
MSGHLAVAPVCFIKRIQENLMAFAKQSAGGGEPGLAILRIGTGATLFLRHGWEKQPMHWAQFMAHFPDPIHIGAHASFFIAFLSDFVCSLLLVLGIWTRWVALFSFCNILVAWALVHRFAFFGRGPGSDHGELMVLYLVALLTLVVTHSTAFSVDSVRGR